MENNKIKKSVKFQGDMLNFCDFIQVFVFTRNHHLKEILVVLEFCGNWSGLITLCKNITLFWSCGPDCKLKFAV